MSLRETLGLVFIILGLVLTPVAWVTSRALWLLAFLLLAIGGCLFVTDRIYRRMTKSERDVGAGGGSHSSGRPMPTDIHNYTGWRSGGRSETMGEGPGGEGGGD
jgi:hypothetical protein